MTCRSERRHTRAPYYRLSEDGSVVPCDVSEVRIADPSNRLLRTELPDCVVSTVFLGVDLSYGFGLPQLWETLVFARDGDDVDWCDIDCERYATREQAELGHAAMVEKWRAARAERDAAIARAERVETVLAFCDDGPAVAAQRGKCGACRVVPSSATTRASCTRVECCSVSGSPGDTSSITRRTREPR